MVVHLIEVGDYVSAPDQAKEGLVAKADGDELLVLFGYGNSAYLDRSQLTLVRKGAPLQVKSETPAPRARPRLDPGVRQWLINMGLRPASKESK